MRCVALLVVMVITLTGYSIGQQFGEPVILSDKYIMSKEIVEGPNGHVWVFWSEAVFDESNEFLSSNLCYRLFEEGQWADEVVIYQDTSHINYLDVMAGDDCIYLAWAQQHNLVQDDFSSEIYLAQFREDEAFEPEFVVTSEFGAEYPNLLPSSEHEVVMVYMNFLSELGGSIEFNEMVYNDGAWSEPQSLTGLISLIWMPLYCDVAGAEDNYITAWQNGDAIKAVHYDGSWSGIVQIGLDPEDFAYQPFSLSADCQTGVIWLGQFRGTITNYDGYLSYFQDGEWSQPEEIPIGGLYEPKLLAINNEQVWLFDKNRLDPPSPLLAYQYSNGNWDGAWPISTNMECGGQIDVIKSNDGFIYCTWLGNNKELFFNYINIVVEGVNEDYSLKKVRKARVSNSPNPFNPTTSINFELGEQGNVSLKIFNVKGQLVNTLINDIAYDSGAYSISWNGKDNRGLAVGSGIYFCHLQFGNESAIHKMLLVK